MNCIRRILPAALLAAPLALSTGQANAQVNVDVDITLNGIVILDYYSTINVNIPSAVWVGMFSGCTALPNPNAIACNQGAAAAVDATFASPNLVAEPVDVATPPPTGVSLAALPLRLEDVWAVRALGTSPAYTVTVSVTDPGGPLMHADGGQILITGSSVNPANFVPLGLVTPVHGDVTLTLDLTGATRAGTYSSAGSNDYALNVVLN